MRGLSMVTALCAIVVGSTGAAQQGREAKDYPSRPLRVVVPYRRLSEA
jgi:hypothetical protein